MKKNIEQNYIPERLYPTPHEGLSDQQVAERGSHGLTNNVRRKYSKSYIDIFTNNICTFFNLLGLLCFISLVATKASLSQFFFVFFYVANISIGIIQEIRAKRCIDKLSLVTAKGAKVVRNSQMIEIPTTEIVLDDIINLGIGNQIPADCKILEGDVEVNEALLTGESVPVKKKVGDTLLAGSFITSGVCFVQAIKVGKDNYVETLSAKAKQYKKPKSEIMNSLKLIIRLIGFVIIPIATAFIIKSRLIVRTNLPDAVLGCSTVVIGMIPAGMFLLTSVALAVGIIKLSKHNTLVQDLYSLEMLARVDTICFDKTGTITDGKMSVTEVVELTDENLSVNEVIGSMLATLKDNNQTAIALYNYFGQNSILKGIASIPFNSTRKFSAVTFEDCGTFAFGAPEFVVDDEEYLKIKEEINEYAQRGLRVLLLAHSQSSIIEEEAPKDFSPVALIIIADNVREDAISTIKWFKDNGVAVKVISGDNPVTVAEVSKRVGIDGAEKYISLEGLSDDEVSEVANEYTVFGRVTPEQKAILIKAMKSAGHVTAMTGDGVNDILALKEADCAITVAEGSDAARNVSHLVLTDNNFNSMPKVVYEGRRVINNVQNSASLFLMKTLFTMFMGTVMLFLPYMSTYPFKSSQMIILEVFIIGMPAFFLSMQPNDARVEGKFISHVIRRALPGAVLMAVSVLLIEFAKITLNIFTPEVYTTMQVFVIYYSGLINLYKSCKPLNIYRAIIFFGSLFIISAIVLVSILSGFPFFDLEKMSPLKVYWHHILVVASIISFAIPLSSTIQTFCDKVELPINDEKIKKL